MTDRNCLRFGRPDKPSDWRPLRAGPLSLYYDPNLGDLRYLRLGDRELVRRIYVAVRDRNWGTIPAVLSGHHLEERDGGFLLRFLALHRQREIAFRSVGYGSEQFVSIQALHNGVFALTDADGDARIRDEGRDASGTVNGAGITGRGLDMILNTRTLDLQFTLNEAMGLGSTSFVITGGGALFQLGPSVNTNQQVNIGIQSIAATRLGDANLGYLSQIVEGGQFEVSRSTENAHQSSLIVERAIRQVAVLRGRLGAFERNVLATNVNSLTITLENLMSSESSIRDTDFAYETSRLTRAQILVNAGTSVLSIANTTPQSVLALLGG